jgi:hypothetical protein
MIVDPVRSLKRAGLFREDLVAGVVDEIMTLMGEATCGAIVNAIGDPPERIIAAERPQLPRAQSSVKFSRSIPFVDFIGVEEEAFGSNTVCSVPIEMSGKPEALQSQWLQFEFIGLQIRKCRPTTSVQSRCHHRPRQFALI